jgi:hypothetical protein
VIKTTGILLYLWVAALQASLAATVPRPSQVMMMYLLAREEEEEEEEEEEAKFGLS